MLQNVRGGKSFYIIPRGLILSERSDRRISILTFIFFLEMVVRIAPISASLQLIGIGTNE
jgi:hypothetical protein